MLDHLNAALADRYCVEREIGRGGNGTVFLARDVKHDRAAAIKVFDPSIKGETDRFAYRFVKP